MNSLYGARTVRAASAETYSRLYIGDYFTDTLHLPAREHEIFHHLLLETWLRSGQLNSVAPPIAGVTVAEWDVVEPVLNPLLEGVRRLIVLKIRDLRAYDGRRLPPADWKFVRSVVFERDGYACTYCGEQRTQLQGDHVVPLCRGGSNAFDNVVAACRPCNQAKGQRSPEEWQLIRAQN
jgi:5-methylcytosine-specific restriction endonuclease McrA